MIRGILVALALVVFAAESNAKTVIVQRRGLFGGTNIVVANQGGLISNQSLLLSQGLVNQNVLFNGGFLLNNGFGGGFNHNGNFLRGGNRGSGNRGSGNRGRR